MFCPGIVFWKTVRIWGYGGLPAVQLGFGPAARWHLTCSMQWVLISQQRHCHQGRTALIPAFLSSYARFRISLSASTFPCSPLEPTHASILSSPYVYLPADLPSGFCEAAGQHSGTCRSSEPLGDARSLCSPAVCPIPLAKWLFSKNVPPPPLLRLTPVILQ